MPTHGRQTFTSLLAAGRYVHLFHSMTVAASQTARWLMFNGNFSTKKYFNFITEINFCFNVIQNLGTSGGTHI